MIARLATPLLLLALGCVTGPPPRTGGGSEDPGELVATQDIPGSFLMRQLIRFRFGEEAGSFEAVIQKHCDEVTVVGLTPFGSPAFSIRQRGLQVEVESNLPGPWPFPPRHVLVDVHRIYFLPLASPAPPDGTHETLRGAETLVERWSSGRLAERSFRRVSGEPPGRVVVTYPGGATSGLTPREARLENERYGYSLHASVVSRTELPCRRDAEGEAPTGRRDGGQRQGRVVPSSRVLRTQEQGVSA